MKIPCANQMLTKKYEFNIESCLKKCCVLLKIVHFLQVWFNKNRKYFNRFHSNGKEHIRCDLCLKYPDTVKLNVYNRKLLPITTETGTIYRSDIIEKHLQSSYHSECEKVERINLLTQPDKILTPIDIAISKANLEQGNHVGGLMIEIFTDAKILSLAGWNWPSRHVANVSSNVFQFDQPKNSVIPDNLPLQYVNPKKHHDLLDCIVRADVVNVKSKIEECLALSLRVDGSVDRSKQDKIYNLG